jgi:ferritin-like metal-binding protein YciE
MKSTLAGETSLQEGLKEQWSRLRQTLTSGPGSGTLDSMDSMYAMELQELHSAEEQLTGLTQEVAGIVGNGALAFRISEYSTELASRSVDLESLLASTGAQVRSHPDDAMRALINEAHKMARMCAPSVRDAALAASLQRIIHYKIAGYGTIASYAKALSRFDDAGFFAELADRDTAIDAEISELAKSTLNPLATQARESITVAPVEETSTPRVRH